MLGLGGGLEYQGRVTSDFSPSNISSLIHWYKHAAGLEDAGGAFPDDDEKITTWRDSKGSNDGTTNGEDILWDNTNKALVADNSGSAGFTLESELTFARAFSLYFRVQFLQAPSATDYFTQDASNANNMFIRIQAANLFRAKIAGTTRTFNAATTADAENYVTGQYYNIGIERDSSNNLRVYRDGVESTTGAITDTGDVIFDLMRCGKEDLYVTTLVFNDALSSGDRAAIETYLSNI